MSKRILGMLLAIVMVVGMMQGALITANAAPSVSTSSNGTVLTISGTGEISKTSLNGVKNKSRVTTIIIKDGITSIAGANSSNSSAFNGFSNVRTITIEGDLNSIGRNAFSNCSRLATINYNGTKALNATNTGLKTTGVTINVPCGYKGEKFCGVTATKAAHEWNYSTANNNTTINVTCGCGQAGGSVTISAPSDLTYDGYAKNAILAFSQDWALGEAAKPDITYNSDNRTNVTGSEIRASISLGGETAFVRYKIEPKDLTDEQVEIALEKNQYDYTGEAITPNVEVTLGDKTLIKDTDYEVSYKDNDKVGTATVTVTFKGNYTGEPKTATFSINKINANEAVVTLEEGNYTYNGEAFEPKVAAVKLGGKTLVKDTDYTVSYENNIVAGENTAKVIVTFQGKYTGKVTKTFTINKADRGGIKLTAPVNAVLPGNVILLAVEGNTEQAGTIKVNGTGFDHVDGLKIKIKEDLVIGQDEVEITVTYEATENYKEATTNKITLEVGMADYTDEIAALEAKIADLEEQIKKGAAVDELAAKIEAIESKIAALENEHATKEELEVAKQELTQLISDAIGKAVAMLDEADKKNAAELEKAVKDLKDLIAIAEKNAADADAALKAALEAQIADANSKIDALANRVTNAEEAIADLKKAVEDLKAAVKSGDDNLAAEIAKLNEALVKAEAASKAADAAMKQDLEDVKAGLTEAFSKAIKDAVAKLEEADKNNAAALEKAVADLEALIEAAKAYADQQDAATKAALEAEIKKATDRIAALENRVGSAEEAIEEIENAIEDLKKADAANAAALEKAIANLNKAIADAKKFATDADAALKRELNKKIEDADKTLNAKIDKVQQNLNKAKADLEKAIAAGDKALDAKITKLNDAMNAADTALKAADAALKKQLEAEIKEANDLIASLEDRVEDAEDAIDALEKAVEALKKVDAANAKELKNAIERLNKAIKDAKDFAAKSDAAIKKELNDKINAADKALEAKIAEVQANLDKAVEDLKAADQANAEKLADAIARLKEAIAAAEAASAASDAVQDEHIIALKNEINRVAIDLENAQANLEKALKSEIETLTSELKRAEEALKNAIDTKADEDTVNAAIAKLQNEIAALEAAKNNYIAADAALKAEVEAVIEKAKQEAIEAAKGHIPYIGENGNWWIGDSDTGVDANGIQGEDGKDGITPQLRVGSGNIWEVSYDNGKTWTSLGVSAVGVNGTNGTNGRNGRDGVDGKDGADGKDGITPELRINEDTNMWEVSYDEGKTWESLGVVASGADGADGADGITPQLRINEKTNMWEVSYDDGATWTSMGVVATGADGSSSVLPLVISCISLAGMIAMLCIMLVDRKKKVLPVGK